MSALKNTVIVRGYKLDTGMVLVHGETKRRLVFVGYDAKVNFYIFLETTYQEDKFMNGISHIEWATEKEAEEINISWIEHEKMVKYRD